ncbi:MAG: NifB/NifX family molybdenum-iron cluster-binding protein [Candidatus Hodarchaeota archaeon]
MKRIAFPTLSEGLDAQLSLHFGHSATFTLIHYEEATKEIIKVECVSNAPHQSGGCMVPVMLLKNEGVDEVVLGGIGMRPLMGFLQVGIKPYAGIKGTVKENFEAFINEKLNEMTQGTCSGGGH